MCLFDGKAPFGFFSENLLNPLLLITDGVSTYAELEQMQLALTGGLLLCIFVACALAFYCFGHISRGRYRAFELP